MTQSTLSSKNQIVVPTAVRNSLGLKSGDKIVYVPLETGGYAIKKQPTIYDLIGSVSAGHGDVVERLRKIRDLDD